jgi:hypothetical protein
MRPVELLFSLKAAVTSVGFDSQDEGKYYPIPFVMQFTFQTRV